MHVVHGVKRHMEKITSRILNTGEDYVGKWLGILRYIRVLGLRYIIYPEVLLREGLFERGYFLGGYFDV